MAMIPLTVRSVNNRNYTAYQALFDTAKMSSIRANFNPNNNVTIAEAGDTQNVLSNWFVVEEPGNNFIYDSSVMYWTFINDGNDRYVNIYSNSGRTRLIATGNATIANGNNGTVVLRGVNDYTFNGSVLVTIAGGGANDDSDAGNTLTFTTVATTRDMQLNGAVEFLYVEPIEVKVKYTVDENLEQIQVLIDAANQGGGIQNPVTLTFVVVDGLGGVLAGAWVIVNGQAGQTNENGVVSFVVEDDVEYLYTVISEDCGSTTGSVVVDGNTIETVELECSSDDDVDVDVDVDV